MGTVDGEKTSEFVFDNTQAKKHIKFFYSPDTYTKDYLYEEEWEYPGNSGIKCKIDFKRGGVSTYNYDGEYSWVNNGNKFEVKSNGFLRRISPVETNVVTSINMRNLKVD